MLRGVPLAAALLLAAAPTAAWQVQIEPSGLRIAGATGEAQVDGRSAPARLELRCMPGDRGTLEWRLAVESASSLGFEFDRFEGPDAAAARERLANLALEGGLLRPRIPPLALAGWYEGADRMVLAFAAPANAGAEGALLADSIGPQSTALSWQVAQSPAGERMLHAHFALAEAAPAVRKAMAGCGPVPPIDAAQRDAWRGRNPHTIDWFAQRTVAWRLEGLLGARHDTVLARLASAQPIGTDGETVFVLAPSHEAPRDGVAVMLRGADTEVVLVDNSVVERLVSGSAAIPLPEAVRGFVAERSAPRD